VLDHLLPPETRDFSLHELDLEETPLREILDQARTPSLMATFQAFFVRGVKALYGRGKRAAEFAAIKEYFGNPNPGALIVFVADHIAIPADARRMELTDKERYERIRETLGELCPLIELARPSEEEAVEWINSSAGEVKVDPDAARELVDALGGNMTMISGELEKLILYVGEKKRITLADVETMVLAAKQRTLYELTDAISAKDRARALAILDAIISTGDGDDAAIGHLYMLARTFRQMLVVSERNVRDTRTLWQTLWPGFRVPAFAADDLIRQARRYKSRREFTRALRLIARADLALRSSPASKRLVLESLVLELSSQPKATEAPPWQQQELLT
jgi:DNA polymerase-3 subunit delta